MTPFLRFEAAYLKKESISTNVGHSHFFRALRSRFFKKEFVAPFDNCISACLHNRNLYRVEVKVQYNWHLAPKPTLLQILPLNSEVHLMILNNEHCQQSGLTNILLA